MANLFDTANCSSSSPDEPDDFALFLRQIMLRSRSSSSSSSFMAQKGNELQSFRPSTCGLPGNQDCGYQLVSGTARISIPEASSAGLQHWSSGGDFATPGPGTCFQESGTNVSSSVSVGTVDNDLNDYDCESEIKKIHHFSRKRFKKKTFKAMLDYEWGNPSTIMFTGDEPTQDADQNRQLFDPYAPQNFGEATAALLNPNAHYATATATATHHHHTSSHFRHPPHEQHQEHSSNPHLSSFYDPRAAYGASSYHPHHHHSTHQASMLSLEPAGPTGFMVVPKSEPIVGGVDFTAAGPRE